jgi:uncharacterized protein YbjT (DUF2867 family)
LPRGSKGYGRLVHISAVGLTADSPVDYFRVKHQVDQIIASSGTPFVLVANRTAYMETWVELIVGAGIRTKGVATLFGNGRRISNFIAVDDVAEFRKRILSDRSVQNETIVVGGPSNASFEQVATLIERALGVTAKRRYVPVPALRFGSIILRPFLEVPARLMAMGYFNRHARPLASGLADVVATFRRVSPMSLEEFCALAVWKR